MEPTKKSNGALVGLIIIILILVLGGWYVWQSNQTESVPEAVTEEDQAELDNLDNDLNTVETDIEANVINSVE